MKIYEILDEYSGLFPYTPSILYHDSNEKKFLIIGGFNGTVGFYNL